MREGNPGDPRRGIPREIPADLQLHQVVGSYKVLHSPSEKCVVIEVCDYHPGPLHLTADDLKQLSKLIPKS